MAEEGPEGAYRPAPERQAGSLPAPLDGFLPSARECVVGDQTFNLFDYSVAVTSADAFVGTLRDLWRDERARRPTGGNRLPFSAPGR